MPHQCTNCGHTFADGSKEMLSGCPDCGGNKFQFKPAGSSDDKPAHSETSSELPSPESSSKLPSPESHPSTSETAQSPHETEGIEDDSGFVSKELKNTDESPAQSSARSDVVSSSELTAVGSAASAGTDDAEAAPDRPTDSAPDTSTDSASEPSTDSASDTSTDSASDTSTDSASEPSTDSASDTSTTSSTDSAPDSSTDLAAESTVDQPIDDSESEESSLDELRKELNDQFESIRIVSPGQYELNLMELYDREEYIISLREDGRYVIEVPDGWGDS